MKHKIVFTGILGMAMACTILSCASSVKNKNIPQWLNELPPANELWGIGSVNLGEDTDPSRTIQVAESRVYTSLTNQIKVSVERVVIDIYQDISGSGENADRFSSVDNLSRTFSSVTIEGAEPNKREQMPDGTWWVRVRIPKAEVSREVATNIDREAARSGNLADRKEESLRLLDRELGKVKPEVVDTAEAERQTAASMFSVPLIRTLENGKYYIQLAAFSKEKSESVKPELSKIGRYYPLAIQTTGSQDHPLYRILLSPINREESGALLQYFRGIGYPDAFVRQGS